MTKNYNLDVSKFYHVRARLLVPGDYHDWNRRTLLQLTLGTFNLHQDADTCIREAREQEPLSVTQAKLVFPEETLIIEYFIDCI